MNFKFLLHTVLSISFIATVCSLDAAFIQEYFNNRYVKWLNFYHCYDKNQEILFLRNFSNDFNIRSFKIDDELVIKEWDFVIKKNMNIGAWIDAINCPYENILEQLSNMRAFKGTRFFLVFMQNISVIETSFEEIVLTVNSNLKILVEDYSMYDVYNPSTLHGGKLIINNFTNWDSESRKFVQEKHEHLYWIRRNMTGVVFKTTVVFPKPFPGTMEEYLDNVENREVNTFNRFHAVLMYHVRDYYNYQLNMSWGRSWGYIQPNGSFDGMVRQIELKQIDFGTSPLFLKNERWKVLDYGRRSWILKSAFIFRTPKRTASFEVFLRPLDWHVWCLTMVAVAIVVVLLRLAVNQEIKLYSYITESVFESSWSNIMLVTLGALCQQGSATSPAGVSSRISFLFIFIFTVLLYQYYSASIVSTLIMAPARFIRTLKDLANSQLTLGCEDNLYNRDYLHKLQNDSIVGGLPYKNPRHDKDTFYVEPEVGLPRVALGGYAFHVEYAIAYPIIGKTFGEDAICSLDAIEMFNVQQMHQVLQKGSEFREMIDYGLHRIDESGIMHRQQRFWHSKRPECIRTRPPTSAVTLEEFYPALCILLIGMIMSLFVLVVEHIFYNRDIRQVEVKMIKELQLDRKHGLIKRTHR